MNDYILANRRIVARGRTEESEWFKRMIAMSNLPEIDFNPLDRWHLVV